MNHVRLGMVRFVFDNSLLAIADDAFGLMILAVFNPSGALSPIALIDGRRCRHRARVFAYAPRGRRARPLIVY